MMKHFKHLALLPVYMMVFSLLPMPAFAVTWPFIDVTAYGASGDNGVTDNFSAFQAAFDAAKTTGIPIFIPNGDYYMSRSINGTTGLDNGGTDTSKPVYRIIGASGPAYKSWTP